MPATIERNRIRSALDHILSRNRTLTDVLTSADLALWHAEDVQLEIALFSNGTIADDISNFDSITPEIKDPANLLGAPLFTLDALKTGSVAPQVDLDPSVSLANWNDGTEQHAVFVLSAADTNLELAGASAKDFTLFFWGNTNDTPARRIPLGKSPITVRDSGYGDLAAITVNPPGARMSASKLQVLNQDDGLYYDLVLRNQNGVPTTSIEGAGEA